MIEPIDLVIRRNLSPRDRWQDEYDFRQNDDDDQDRPIIRRRKPSRNPKE